MILVETRVARHYTSLITQDLWLDSSDLLNQLGARVVSSCCGNLKRLIIHILGESSQGCMLLLRYVLPKLLSLLLLYMQTRNLTSEKDCSMILMR